MQNRFEFLEDQFPKLADYGQKAENSFDVDKNICLLNLGRLAENIIEILCERCNIPDRDVEKLLTLGFIEKKIYAKIIALLEVEHDAANDEYASDMACSRLMLTAEELCRWFMYEAIDSKFSFLADLFPEDSPLPPLANLALFGREAEENLLLNPRYALICLGDIGEAIVNFLINLKHVNINFHDNDQSDKIKILYREGIINKEVKDILHDIRLARNDAVHSRYNSEEECKNLLEQALPLCEWLFKLTMSPGDFVRGKISGIRENCIDVAIGRFQGIVENEEFDSEEISEGKRKIFKIIDIDGEKLHLSLQKVYTNPWINAVRRYEKYKIGQDLKVKILRIEKDIGATVEVCGAHEPTEARIPENEYGSVKIVVNSELKARVKWFNPSKYPYMILSAKDAPQEINFIRFCANASPEEILEKLPEIEDINKKNVTGMTALMMAALHNPNPEVINILVKAGAKVNAKNYAENTPLILAAMLNNQEVIAALLENHANIEILSRENKYAYDYALNNPKLEDAEVVRMLKVKKLLNDEQFLQLCASGSSEDIVDAIETGSNIKARDSNNNTALMSAARYNYAEIINLLLSYETDAKDIDCVDAMGNSALMIACSYNTGEAVKLLLEAGADANLQNNAGYNALMIASRTKHLDSIQELLPKINDINAQNNNGDTALIIASEFNTADTVSAILGAGAEVDMQNNNGTTALIAAVNNSVDAENVLKALLKAKPNLNIHDKNKYRAVDIARLNPMLKGSHALVIILKQHFLKLCVSGTSEEISEYIRAGVNVNIRSAKNSATALMFAVQDNNCDAVKVLLDADADINAQDSRGYTALILAAGKRDEELVTLLLDYEADVNITDSKGYKALNYAAGNPKLKGTDIIKRLRKLTHN